MHTQGDTRYDNIATGAFKALRYFAVSAHKNHLTDKAGYAIFSNWIASKNRGWRGR